MEETEAMIITYKWWPLIGYHVSSVVVSLSPKKVRIENGVVYKRC